MQLSPDIVLAYARDGVVTIPSLLTSLALSDLLLEADRLLAKATAQSLDQRHVRWMKTKEGLPYCEKIDPVTNISLPFKMLFESDMMRDIAAQLIGCNCAIPFRDKVIFKPPGAPGYPMHQDFSWWHSFEPNSMCTVALALTPCSRDGGAVQFFLGTHRKAALPPGERRALMEGEIAECAGKAASLLATMDAGDATAFHSLALHWSPPNYSVKNRSILYLGYIDAVNADAYQRQRDVQERNLKTDLETSSGRLER